jgi:DNA polymerase I-like protein with 3'-5' exonuclease and polymerase domains
MDFLFHVGFDEENIPYLGYLKAQVNGRANVRLNNLVPQSKFELVMEAKKLGVKHVATTSEKQLHLLLGTNRGSLDDYAGSIIELSGIEFLILNPLQHCITTSPGKFLLNRYIRKFIDPTDWLQIPEFSWKLFEPMHKDELLSRMGSATFISADIETKTEEGQDGERLITCIGFTEVHVHPETNSFTSFTTVVPFTDAFNLAFARTVLRLPVLKVFQNGKYDNAHLLRYRCPTNNWGGDTQHLFHSWYSELPKRLDFITAFLLRKWQYWKDESQSGNLMDYYGYNAKDAFTTAMSWLALLQEVPEWAWANYYMEFPLVFPCLVAEMTGIRADAERVRALSGQLEAAYLPRLKKIRTMVANPYYNPGSPPQTKRLFEILGCGDLPGTGKIPMDKAKARHPLNKRILGTIQKYREDKKLDDSFLDTEKIWHGRWFFALNPHGTDTGRLASKESAFWCGQNVQNIPRDKKDIQIKEVYVSDPDFYFGECDYEQNEARGTGYLSGDVKLIEAVEDPSKDFHGRNASMFFGVPYEKIVNSYQNEFMEWVHETIDKELRDLSKRTNHGSNYNMGENVLLDTMGIENVIRAKRLLKLPQSWSLLQVTRYLLTKYADTYKTVKGPWYEKCFNDVSNSHMLVGPTGWTRWCFGDPTKSKRDKNRYVAHPPQSLAAMLLNKAYLKVMYEVYFPNVGNFKMGPQIHDSILFQYRKGHEHLAWQVKKCMELTTPVKDTFGITRNLFVPVALKGGATRWSDVKTLKRAA